MKRALIAAVLIALVVGAGINFFPQRSQQPVATPPERADRTADPEPAQPSGASLTESESDEVTLDLPAVDEIRAEIARNPHARSGVLQKFAHNLAEHRLQARESTAYAEKLFEALRHCVLDDRPGKIPAAQGLCAANAAELSVDDPDRFGERYAKIQEKLSPDVLAIAQAVGPQ